jgi:hypothetical protein
MPTGVDSQYRSNHTWSETSGDASSNRGYDDEDTSTINDDIDEVQTVRLIIAIDFGTTFTGIAYATPHGTSIPLPGIEIVRDWGSACMSNLDKIDSVISYSARTRDGQEANWGSNLAPGAIAMKHMKLRLDVQSVSEEIDFILQMLDGIHDLNFEKIKRSGRMEEYTHKPADAVVTDYLTKVFEHVLQTVDRFSRELREEIVTDIVFTVPVVCTVLCNGRFIRWLLTNYTGLVLPSQKRHLPRHHQSRLQQEDIPTVGRRSIHHRTRSSSHLRRALLRRAARAIPQRR